MPDRLTVPSSQRSGILISMPIDNDRVQQQDTVSCCHCGRVWLWVKGSGRVRGWCMRCNGVTCGNQACDECVPMLQMIQNLENGMSYEEARRHRNIIVSVPGLILSKPVQPTILDSSE